MTTALGFRAHRGGATAVAIALENGAPRLVLSTTLATGVEDDRLTWEPYHLAAGIEGGARTIPPPDPDAVVALGRAAQVEIATASLGDLLARMTADGARPAVAAVLANRVYAGFLDDLAHILAWDEHLSVAESLAVREAVCSALDAHDLARVEVDEKSIRDVAPERLGLAEAVIDARLKELGAAAGRPWRKEQKNSALAAWIAAADPAG
jgi:hypothetical protein